MSVPVPITYLALLQGQCTQLQPHDARLCYRFTPQEVEKEGEMKRMRKEADQAFLELLRSAQPPIRPTTTLIEVQDALASDKRYKNVESDARRRELFAAFVLALRQLEEKQVANAEQNVARLLKKLNVRPETEWSQVRACSTFDSGRRACLAGSLCIWQKHLRKHARKAGWQV